MKSILLIRRKKNYYNNRDTSDWYSDTMVQRWDTNKKIKMWNENFSVPFFEMRREINRIAFEDIEEMKFDIIFDHVDEKKIKKIKKIKDAWLVPVDDDDLLPFSLSNELKKIDLNHQVCSWSALQIKCFDQENIKFINSNKNNCLLLSCCYALSTEFIDWDSLQHEWTKSKKAHFIKNIESLSIKTPLSTLVMKFKIQNLKDMIEMFDKIKNLNENLVPQEFKNKVIKIKNLFKDCKIKKIY